MRLLPVVAISCLVLSVCMAAHATDNQIVAQPEVVTPGQTVTLKWYFTGDKVTVSGGRFGAGAVVTGRQSLTDRPMHTTRYTFDVIYHGSAPANATGGRVVKKLHSRYSVVVEVFRMPAMQPYRASNGWTVNYVKGWQHVNIPTSEMAKDGLAFFQPEEDSVERMAVAVVPVKSMTCDELMQHVESDMPTNYDKLEFISRDAVTYRNIPAILMTFRGADHSHPGTSTQSLVLTFVYAGRGYVVSARTHAARFAARRPILERMVRSFAPPTSTAGAQQ